MTHAMLADVRDLIERHLPKEFRAKPTWRYVTAQLTKGGARYRHYR
jgi:hypothetical protein